MDDARPPDRVPAAADALQEVRGRDGRALDPVRDRSCSSSCCSRTWAPSSGRRCRPQWPWRSGRSGCASTRRTTGAAARARRPARRARRRRAARGHVRRRAELPAVAGARSPRSRRSRPRGREAGFTPERTQVRLVRQGLTGHPFWAVSFSVPAAVRRRLREARRPCASTRTPARSRRSTGSARPGSSSPSRRASHGAGRGLEQQRGDDRERHDARRAGRRSGTPSPASTPTSAAGTTPVSRVQHRNASSSRVQRARAVGQRAQRAR